jgi:hypothetical protein
MPIRAYYLTMDRALQRDLDEEQIKAAPHAIGAPNPTSPVRRATPDNTIPKQPLTKSIQAVIVERDLNIVGIFLTPFHVDNNLLTEILKRE